MSPVAGNLNVHTLSLRTSTLGKRAGIGRSFRPRRRTEVSTLLRDFLGRLDVDVGIVIRTAGGGHVALHHAEHEVVRNGGVSRNAFLEAQRPAPARSIRGLDNIV